jgi:hypothetical protein
MVGDTARRSDSAIIAGLDARCINRRMRERNCMIMDETERLKPVGSCGRQTGR